MVLKSNRTMTKDELISRHAYMVRRGLFMAAHEIYLELVRRTRPSSIQYSQWWYRVGSGKVHAYR